MMNVVEYKKIENCSLEFIIDCDEQNQITAIRSPRDLHHMNWVLDGKTWGTLNSGIRNRECK